MGETIGPMRVNAGDPAVLDAARVEEELTAFFGDHYERMVRLAGLVCRRGVLPEDAVQAAMEQAWRSRASLRDRDRLRWWLDRIVVREAILMNRRPWWKLLAPGATDDRARLLALLRRLDGGGSVIWRRTTASMLLFAALLAACGADQPSESLEASAAASAGTVTLGSGEVELEAGTYRFDLTALSGGDPFPTFEATVPAGWTSSGGWAVARAASEGEDPAVAVTFWNVDAVYGHPCQWDGSLVQPGPTVEDLVAALVDVPMRDATRPLEVEIDGHHGMYLEWSVPSDLAFDDGAFPDCDRVDFRSWTGKGWASTRYHQAPGQVDRLWILDVDGTRLVIDAFVMPDASATAVEELTAIVSSIQFTAD